MASKETVLVTGGSGFIGSHCLLQVVLAGYSARTTVRTMANADRVRAMMRKGGASDAQTEGIQFFEADLTKDAGWETAVAGCEYVHHVASPFPLTVPKHEDDLIVPARDGTLRVLRAAKVAGTVKRVVLTSSFAAIGFGYPDKSRKFDETDWSQLDNPDCAMNAYQKSKTIAEHAAWDFVEKEGGDMQLVTVCPVGVFGPILSKEYATSIELISRMCNGTIPGLPNISMGVVDVRDVASLHMKAMTEPQAAGQRYLACADGDFLWYKEIAAALKEGLPAADARRVPTRSLPDFVLRLVAYIDKPVGLITPELSKYGNGTNEKAKTELGWQPKSANEAILSAARSLKDFGLVK